MGSIQGIVPQLLCGPNGVKEGQGLWDCWECGVNTVGVTMLHLFAFVVISATCRENPNFVYTDLRACTPTVLVGLPVDGASPGRGEVGATQALGQLVSHQLP